MAIHLCDFSRSDFSISILWLSLPAGHSTTQSRVRQNHVTAIVMATRACSGEVYPPLLPVTRGLDPRVHLLRMKMDCRVKPGNDIEQMSAKRTLGCGRMIQNGHIIGGRIA